MFSVASKGVHILFHNEYHYIIMYCTVLYCTLQCIMCTLYTMKCVDYMCTVYTQYRAAVLSNMTDTCFLLVNCCIHTTHPPQNWSLHADRQGTDRQGQTCGSGGIGSEDVGVEEAWWAPQAEEVCRGLQLSGGGAPGGNEVPWTRCPVREWVLSGLRPQVYLVNWNFGFSMWNHCI